MHYIYEVLIEEEIRNNLIVDIDTHLYRNPTNFYY